MDVTGLEPPLPEPVRTSSGAFADPAARYFGQDLADPI